MLTKDEIGFALESTNVPAIISSEEVMRKYRTPSSDLIAAYEATHFRVGGKNTSFALRIGEFSPQLVTLYIKHQATGAVYITAWNPRSRRRSPEQNALMQERLRSELDSLKPLLVLEGVGEDPSGNWPGEPSYLALGITKDQGTELARQFGQNAFLWIGADAIPWLVTTAL